MLTSVGVNDVCIMMVCHHSQKVQAFPGDQRVRADPSCLSLPCLQRLPSHHGVLKVPMKHKHTHSQKHQIVTKEDNFHAHMLCAGDVVGHILCLSSCTVLTAAPLAPAGPTFPEEPLGP